MTIAGKRRFDPAHVFQPESVVLSGTETALGRQVRANIEAGVFEGVFTADPQGMKNADLALITEDEADVPQALARHKAQGARCVMVLSDVQNLRELARKIGIRALGPFSYGMVLPRLGLNASILPMMPISGNVALVGQSPSIARSIIDWAVPNAVGFSQIIGIGGNTDMGFGLVLDHLSRDGATGAILLEIDRLRDPKLFLSAARAAARLRPVIAVAPGLSFSDPSGFTREALEAAFSRTGILLTFTISELLAAAETLTRVKPARGESLAILSNSRTAGRLAADCAIEAGITLSEFSPETKQVLALSLGEVPGPGPIYAGRAATKLADLAALLSSAHEVGGILVIHAPSGVGDEASIEALLACAKTVNVPLLIAVLGQQQGLENRRRLARAGLACFETPEEAVAGFRHLIRNRRNRAAARELPSSKVLQIAPDMEAVKRIIAAARETGKTELNSAKAMDVLNAYQINVAVVHKAPAKLDRLRLRIVVRDHALMGPVISFGAGGGDPEDRTGVATELPPLNLILAKAMIRRSGVSQLLKPRRGIPILDEDAIAALLVRVSQLLIDTPDMLRLDLDPVFVTQHDDISVAGAQMILRPSGAARPPLMISPYPEGMRRHFESNGERFLLRPIRPEDADAHAALFTRFTPDDMRFRFFSAIKHVQPEQITRMTDVDYAREMAIIAVREGTCETAGAARLVRSDTDGAQAEFAVAVEPAAKSKGLATALMQDVIAWGRAQGVAEITGQILSDNTPMLAFIRKLGFTVAHMPDDPDIMEAKLILEPQAKNGLL